MGKGIKEGFMKGMVCKLVLKFGWVLIGGDVRREKDSKGRGSRNLNGMT